MTENQYHNLDADANNLLTLAARHLDELGDVECWGEWQELADGSGRVTKVPFVSGSNVRASSTNPASWGLLSRAREGAANRRQMLLRKGRKGGVAIVLGELNLSGLDQRNAIGLGGIDLDSCYDPETDKITDPVVKEIIDRFRTYAEFSPSGKGVKIFFFYRLHDAGILNGRAGRSFSRGSHEEVAIHFSGRYFAVTFDSFDDEPWRVKLVDRETLEWLVEDAGPRYLGASPGKKASSSGTATKDGSRSGRAFALAVQLKQDGKGQDDFIAALMKEKDLADWARDQRQVHRAWDRALDGSDSNGLMRSKSGEPLNNLSNAISMLRADEEFPLSFDEMQSVSLVAGEHLTDIHVTRLTEHLQHKGLRQISESNVHSAINAVSRENGFHPIRTYLGSLVHDGVPRLDAWLIRHLGAEDNPYIRKIGRLFLISMVARVMRPGAKVDYMLVLEGTQGEGKSTACRILAGEKYFRDNLPDISNKDAAIALVGMWLVEFAELEGFGKKDATEIKAFLTRQSDKYRPPYGRNEVVSKRQNVFIGSTNSDTYLKDATGGRRFWPVKCGELDLPGLQRNRDQLFAEAYLAYLDCEAWWPDREFAAEHIVTEQAARYESDPWEDPIRRFLSSLESDRVSAADILTQVVSLPIAQRNQQATRRVTDILRRLGWDRWRSNGNNLWRRPTVASRPKKRV